MALEDDLNDFVSDTFKFRWTTRDGKVIPGDTDIKLGNDGVYLDAVCLYADIVGSTELVDTKKDTFAVEIYKNFLYCASKLIVANGGEVTAFDGDRVMGVYIDGSKNSNAAKCALQINHAVAKIINPAIKKQYEGSTYQLVQCVGIDTSKILVAKTGIRGSNDLVWVGRSGNYAAKLCALRKPSYKTFITETVYNSLLDDSKYGGAENKDMWTREIWPDNDIVIYGSNWIWSI